MPKLHFQFRLAPVLATLAGLLLFVGLGLWQSGKGQRLAEERARHVQRGALPALRVGDRLLQPEQVRDAKITVSGRYETEFQFFVDNRQEDGRPGVHVVTPLKVGASEVRILVNRGWVAWPDRSLPLPKVATPDGVVQVNGVANVPSTRKFFLMPERMEVNPKLWARVDIARAEKMLGQPVQPVVLLQSQGDAMDGLVRRFPPPEDRVAMHQGYAFQWFGMALALAVFFLVTGFRREDSA